jgi:NhaA family Na+:H+ antiporter
MTPSGQEHIRRTWSRSDRIVPRVIVRPLQEFLETSTAAASVLLGAIVLALAWVNSPWRGSYASLWSTTMSVRLGSFGVSGDLRFWIEDGLMTFFFLLAGLEIKRELTTGELRRPKVAALPVIAAVGGMVMPALLYLTIVHDAALRHGWGIPMATDIALALGVLTLSASTGGDGLRPMLLTLAIVDDIGAIVVIAVFYSGHGEAAFLLLGVIVVAAIAVGHRLYIRATWLYVALGIVLWYATYRAGVHPTIAGVVLGLLTPAAPFQRPAAVSAEAKRTADSTEDHPHPPDADARWWLRLSWLSREAVSPLARVEHLLLPWSSFVILPLFALANAGVVISRGSLTRALSGELGLAIIVGLVIGKPLGVLLASRLAVSTRAATLSPGIGWGDVAGIGATAGVGFTVGLFIAGLAFARDPVRLDEAKVAILVASTIAGVVATVLLHRRRRAGLEA